MKRLFFIICLSAVISVSFSFDNWRERAIASWERDLENVTITRNGDVFLTKYYAFSGDDPRIIAAEKELKKFRLINYVLAR